MAKEKEEKKVNKKSIKKNTSKKKDNVKKVDIDKKEEVKEEVVTKVLDEIKKEEVVTEPVLEETIVMAALEDSKADAKIEKKKRFWDEVKSFFILIIIIGLVILGGWLFIKYAKPFDSKKDSQINASSGNDVKSEVSYVSYEKVYDNLTVIGDKYLIDKNDENIKIMDLDLNVLTEFEDDTDYQFLTGIDGGLYAIEYFDIDTSINALFLYVLENDKLVQVKELVDEDTEYNLIMNDDKLVGIYERKTYLSDENSDMVHSNTIYKLSGEESYLGDFTLESEEQLLDMAEDYYIVNNNYVVISENVDDTSLFGIYDLNKDEVVVEPNYDAIYATNKDAFIVEKDGKTGIINSKRKLLVDYEYDFIHDNDDFYVVSKKNKLAIMNSDYELVTDFSFDFQGYWDREPEYYYKLCCANFNTFKVYKHNDRYVLTINYGLYGAAEDGYKKNESYIISEDGSYLTIEANLFEINGDYATAYLFESKELIVYETEEFKELYRLDFSDYDYDEMINSKMFGDSLIVSLDSALYYNIEDGKEKDETVLYTKDNVTFKYNYEEDTVVALVDGKTFEFDIYNVGMLGAYPVDLEDGSFYFITGDEFVKINKR